MSFYILATFLNTKCRTLGKIIFFKFKLNSGNGKISKNHINFALLKWNSSFLAKFRQFKKTGGGGFSYINFGSELGHSFHTRRVGRWILPSVPSESILPSVP